MCINCPHIVQQTHGHKLHGKCQEERECEMISEFKERRASEVLELQRTHKRVKATPEVSSQS